MATRERQVVTLYKGEIDTLYPIQGVESLVSANGWDTFINGQDFRVTPAGKLVWCGDEKRFGQDVTIVYQH